MRPKRWTEEQLKNAVKSSSSLRQVINKLGLIEAGGNYSQIKKYIKNLNIKTNHFRGQVWNKGLKGRGHFLLSLEEILVKNSNYQSFKLKKRLFISGIKRASCEICGWAKKSVDGRLPLELDHINGNRQDNSIKNLRILCPNCHSLQPTHRGRNIKVKMGQWRNWHTRDT